MKCIFHESAKADQPEDGFGLVRTEETVGIKIGHEEETVGIKMGAPEDTVGIIREGQGEGCRDKNAGGPPVVIVQMDEGMGNGLPQIDDGKGIIKAAPLGKLKV